MIRWILGDFSDAYILVKKTITVPKTAAASAAVNNTNKKIVFKNWTPFTSFITKINNTQVDYAEDFDTVMPMFNLIECRITYLKASRRLWQYYRDEPTIEGNNNIMVFLLINLIVVHSNSNRANRKMWYKKCWNNGFIKIFK